jgi:uncharacterized protein (DUF488 family)
LFLLHTVGHSNQPFESFLRLLRRHEIELIIDCRSYPRSRYAHQFDRESIESSLRSYEIAYRFMGRELGGRPAEKHFYDDNGRVLYSLLAGTPRFKGSIEQAVILAQDYRVALMCSEENPENCHRRLLIARVLVESGCCVLHIRADGRLQSEQDLKDGQAGDETHPRQMPLFEPAPDRAEDMHWRSTRSVLRRNERKPSSAH